MVSETPLQSTAKRTVASFLDSSEVTGYSKKVPKASGNMYEPYMEAEPIRSSWAKTTDDIRKAKSSVDSGKKTVASFLDSPEVRFMSAKTPKPDRNNKWTTIENIADDPLNAQPIRYSWATALSDAAKAVKENNVNTKSQNKAGYVPRTLGKYERAVKQDRYEKLREIASNLRDYDNDRKRFGDRAKFPKFTGIDYEKLSPAEKAIVDRLRR